MLLPRTHLALALRSAKTPTVGIRTADHIFANYRHPTSTKFYSTVPELVKAKASGFLTYPTKNPQPSSFLKYPTKERQLQSYLRYRDSIKASPLSSPRKWSPPWGPNLTSVRLTESRYRRDKRIKKVMYRLCYFLWALTLAGQLTVKDNFVGIYLGCLGLLLIVSSFLFIV